MILFSIEPCFGVSILLTTLRALFDLSGFECPLVAT
jgi:hypothetical protein